MKTPSNHSPNAPDPLAVVQQFVRRFRPSMWSGSMVSILEGRQPLLEALKNHRDPMVAAFVTARIGDLKKEVEEWRKEETARDQQRDERFE